MSGGAQHGSLGSPSSEARVEGVGAVGGVARSESAALGRNGHGNGDGAGSGVVRGAAHGDEAVDTLSEADSAIRVLAGMSDPSLRPDVSPTTRSYNRDLSWLEFNRRVLHQALDPRVPLLERVKFLAIFSNNLDEFVMKRVAWLKRRVQAASSGVLISTRHDDQPPRELLRAVRATIRQLQQTQAEAFDQVLRPALAEAGIVLAEYVTLNDAQRAWVDRWYRDNVFPILTPLAVDPSHRFPFISNLSRNFGVLVRDPQLGDDPEVSTLFARVKIPSMLPQWIRMPSALWGETRGEGGTGGAGGADQGDSGEDSGRGWFVGLRDLVEHNLDDLFPGMQIVDSVAFRLTRDAGPEPDDEDAESLLEAVEAQLRHRRFAKAVRLEVPPSPSPRILADLLDELGLSTEDVDARPGPLDYTTLFTISELPRPDLKWPAHRAAAPRRLRDAPGDMFSVIRQQDLLVHHPYESFELSAQRFIREAAMDPDVLAIKQTIYRTSKDSPFIKYLIRAAERGKAVACLVELRARFDEQSNVHLARMLEKAGVHVAYGVVGLKTHCKAALVVRREGAGLRTYAHIGTGNYHPKTAHLYTDIGLFTCDPDLTSDIAEMFNLLTGRSRRDSYQKLLVAPATMRRRFIEMIDEEIAVAGRFSEGLSPVNGRIIAKMNAMEDAELAEKLYEASAAGVEITLFVRGFCCIRAGVEGLSENIRVVSIVGRFLEHSRIFHFGKGMADPLDGEWYIGSADWMHRNLSDRVEAAAPVCDRGAKERLLRIFEVMQADQRKAWDLQPDGSYVMRLPPADAAPGSAEHDGTFELMIRDAARG